MEKRASGAAGTLTSTRLTTPQSGTMRTVAVRPFGIFPARTSVEVGPGGSTSGTGTWKLLTPRANVVAAHVTGDFSFRQDPRVPHICR